ncbi:MAG: helix-turn-helix transcriptional regulator, partial [Flavobacteriales bacterium]
NFTDISKQIDCLELRKRNFELLQNIDSAYSVAIRLMNFKETLKKQNDKKLEKEILARFSVESSERELKLIQQENELLELKSNKEKQQKYFGFGLFGLALISLILIISRHRKYKKQKEESTRLKLESAQATIDHSKEILQNQSKLILDKNRAINELRDNIESYFGKEALNDEKMQHFLESKILTKEDWDNFKSSFSVVYPEFISQAKAKFDKLTESELRLLCLSKLGLDKTEIAKMLGVLPKSVQRTIYRFTTKFNIPAESDLQKIVF